MRILFDLKSAPSPFHRTMDNIRSTVKWQFALESIDDVVPFSRSFEEHLQHLPAVLGPLSRDGVSLELKKCIFFEDAFYYLGRLILVGRAGISTKATHAITRPQQPTKVTERKSFLSLCNVCRRFLAGFARIAAMLNCMLGMDQPFHFGRLNQTEIEVPETLQHRLLSPFILPLLRPNGRHTLGTNARDKQVRCNL